MPDKEALLREQIIQTGKALYDLRLVTARSGNLSARIAGNVILITATGTSLGSLNPQDIIRVDLDSPADKQNRRLSTEFPLHSLIYANFANQAVIHCHPPLINAYFAVCAGLKTLTFEAKFYLGDVPVIEQDTPSITRPELVVAGLKGNNLAVIKNHGVAAIGDDFRSALYLIETLEEAVRVNAVARLFNKEAWDSLDRQLADSFSPQDEGYEMFSENHIRKIVELVNKDELIADKGKESGMSLKLAIKLDGDNRAYKFDFKDGRIIGLESDADAPFVISAPGEVWEQVFLGKLDPFVATTQGRMKLRGELGKLSRWYVPFNRLFELFKRVRIK